jgi:hypothetical protein
MGLEVNKVRHRTKQQPKNRYSAFSADVVSPEELQEEATFLNTLATTSGYPQIPNLEQLAEEARNSYPTMGNGNPWMDVAPVEVKSVASDNPYRNISHEASPLSRGLTTEERLARGLSKATGNNNPGNITGMGGKLLYGAIDFARSSTGDKGDQNQLVYSTPQAGFEAMHRLAVDKYSNGPIKTAFAKWQTDKKAFQNKLNDLAKYGVDINKPYSKLDKDSQKLFRKIWSQHEGYRGEFY